MSALNQWVTPDIDIALIVGSFGASGEREWAGAAAGGRGWPEGLAVAAVVGVRCGWRGWEGGSPFLKPA